MSTWQEYLDVQDLLLYIKQSKVFVEHFLKSIPIYIYIFINSMQVKSCGLCGFESVAFLKNRENTD